MPRAPPDVLARHRVDGSSSDVVVGQRPNRTGRRVEESDIAQRWGVDVQGDEVFFPGVFDPVDIVVMARTDISLLEITASRLDHGAIAGVLEHGLCQCASQHQDATATASMVVHGTGLPGSPANTNEFPSWTRADGVSLIFFVTKADA